jgi:hypothetical protein
LLERAQRSGATYVADLAFHLVFRRRGVIVECETRAVFGDDPALRPLPPAPPEPEGTYATEVTSYEPAAHAFTNTERELACARVPVQVIENVPRYQSTYDVDVARILDEVPIDHESVIKAEERCELHDVTRTVTRYDYQQKLAYVPPSWAYIAARYAGEPLRETAPTCYAVDPGTLGPHPTHRLTATLVFRGGVAQHEPLVLPSARKR